MRSKMTGQFIKPIFELILHDFSNLSVQVIDHSENRYGLEVVANNLNNMFIQAGRDRQFVAEVFELVDEVA